MDYLPLLADDGPRYLALSTAIIDDIRSGRLPAGTRLPGSRSLAGRLQIHRNTIVRAYGELTAQGWTTAEVGSGTVVAPLAPGLEKSRQERPTLGFSLPSPTCKALPDEPAHPYAFLGGQPDLRLFPTDLLSRAYRRALKRRGPVLADYGDPQGWEGLRTHLATWLGAQRALSTQAEQILITRGAQQALYLIAHTVFRPGDRVGVEAYGYAPAWEALRTAGVELVPLPVDQDGLVVESIRQQPDLKGIYLTPHHQYPTGAMLSAPRRSTLLHLARDRRIAILEDDYAHEFHWKGHPVAPLAARDPHGVVIYIGTLSKAFAPGIRLGWIAAPTALIERLTTLRRLVDRQGDQVVEQAITELIRDGDLDRHIRRMHRAYRDRREALLSGLRTHLPDLKPFVPPGGLAIWADAAGIDVDGWNAEAMKRDAYFTTAQHYRLDGRSESAIRLGFANLNPAEIEEGLTRLSAALAATRKPHTPARWSRRFPSESCVVHGFSNADTAWVRKRFRSRRSFEQERDALQALVPERLLHADQTLNELRMVLLPGVGGSLDPEAHRQAGVWLRALHDRPCEDTDIPLEQALQLREDAIRGSAGAHFSFREVEQALTGFDPRKLKAKRVWCHRDFRPANWLWDGHALTVIDFEHFRADHPLTDLVKLADEVWPDHPELEAAFRSSYGPFDDEALGMLRQLYALQTRVWCAE